MTQLATADPEVAGALTSVADRNFVLEGRYAVELLALASQRFWDRTCLVSRDPEGREQRLTYGDLWTRVEALAGALHHELGVQPGDRVGLGGPSSPDWLVADMACLHVGAVSVPVDANSGVEELARVVQEASPRCFVGVSPPGMQGLTGERLGELEGLNLRYAMRLPPPTGALHSIVYTSGSTGPPKGVMLPYSRWTQTLKDAVHPRSSPRIDLGYLPLAHMAGRITFYKAFMSGGVVYLAGGASLSNFLEDLAWARPTHLLAVPRVSQFLYRKYRRDSHTRESFQGKVLGGRLAFVHTGAAATPPELVSFLRRDLALHVTDVYGSTEMGPIAVNGRVYPWISYRLVDRPELGFTTSDQPFPRGELAVKSERATPGYFNNPEATAKLVDETGYLLSGDIVAERAPGRIVWLERRQGILRMGHGKFVQVARLEALFAAQSPLVDQIYLHGETTHESLLAVVVPVLEFEGDQDSMLSELRRVAADHQLSPHEVPRAVLLERRPFTTDNGLLSAAKKPVRPRLRERYEADLKHLYRQMEFLRQERAATGLLEMVAQVLGLTRVDAEQSFVALGGDSLAAAEVSARLEAGGRGELSAGLLLNRNLSLAQLARRLEGEGLGYLAVHGQATEARPRDLAKLRCSTERRTVSRGRSARRVLLTGATGFLGRHLCLELLRRLPPDGHLTLLVRGSDHQSAACRLDDLFMNPEMAREFAGLSADRLGLVVGDLGCPGLGLNPHEWGALADEIEVVIHAGALVNHLLPYRDLFETNVLGTAHLLEWAARGRPKAIHYLSSAGLFAGLKGAVAETDTALELWPYRPLREGGYAHGYLTGKWASEILLDWFREDTGLPVTLWRCGLLLPGSEFSGEFNPEDAFFRMFYGMLKTGLAPESFYRRPSPYQALRVDVAASAIAAVALEPSEALDVYHLVPGEAGPNLDQILDWAQQEFALERLPYPEFFSRFKAALETLAEPERRRSPAPILEHWRKPFGPPRVTVDSRRFQEVIQRYGLAAPEVGPAEILPSLRKLQ